MIIGIERSDGGLSVMTIVGEAHADEIVNAEIADWETANGQGWTCVTWVELADYPPREDRNAYELKAGKAVLNQTKIVPPAPTLEERIAALEKKLLKK